MKYMIHSSTNEFEHIRREYDIKEDVVIDGDVVEKYNMHDIFCRKSYLAHKNTKYDVEFDLEYAEEYHSKYKLKYPALANKFSGEWWLYLDNIVAGIGLIDGV